LNKFPQIEQVQFFMQLILNGLSQNSHLSLNEKKEIIEWYRNYFEENSKTIKSAIEAERFVNSTLESASSASK
jgi:hypothetical protein